MSTASIIDGVSGREQVSANGLKVSLNGTNGIAHMAADSCTTATTVTNGTAAAATAAAAANDVHDCRILSSQPLETSQSKWIGLTSIKYRDPRGKERLWESAERKTRGAEPDSVDAVGIVAFLEYPPTHERGDSRAKGPWIVLQKQFRPAVGKVCIEVPAGLVDAGESIETAALRELHEETGYVGRVIRTSSAATKESEDFGVSMTIFNDPGFCTTSTQMAHVSVDMTDPRNQHPRPQLEEGEFIECFEVELGQLWRECRRLEAQGYAIDARVGGLAEGVECARRFGLR